MSSACGGSSGEGELSVEFFMSLSVHLLRFVAVAADALPSVHIHFISHGYRYVNIKIILLLNLMGSCVKMSFMLNLNWEKYKDGPATTSTRGASNGYGCRCCELFG